MFATVSVRGSVSNATNVLSPIDCSTFTKEPTVTKKLSSNNHTHVNITRL